MAQAHGSPRAMRRAGRVIPNSPLNLGVDSLSILSNNRSFQKPAVSTGFFMVS